MPQREAIHINNLDKAYGVKEIFSQASASILEGEIYGVIGRNGAGKSTLFRILLGQEELDLGEIELAPWVKIGHIPQEDPFVPGESIQAFLERWTGVPEWDIAKQAGQFELQDRLDEEVMSLSGGYRMRVKLLSMILMSPNMILLDEPTNYLDLSTILLLERWIQNYSGTVLLITHDREFIRRVSTSIMEIDHGQIETFPGDIDSYLERKELLKDQARRQNQNIEKKQQQLQEFVDRFGAKASKAKQAKSKQKQIARMDADKQSMAAPSTNVRMFIPPVFHKNSPALNVSGLAIGYPEATIAQNIRLEVNRGDKIAVLGDNGQGKSTLIKTLAGFLPPIEGEVSWTHTLRVGYFGQHMEEELPYDMTVYEYFRAKVPANITDEQVKATLGSFLFSEGDWQKTIEVLSGGEKSRLNLAQVFLGGYDILLLDEPTNHLDVETVEIMAASLADFVGTVLFVSHDRTFVNSLAKGIWLVGDGTVQKYPGTYQEYVWSLEQGFLASEKKRAQSTVDTVDSISTSQKSPDEQKQRQRDLFQAKKEMKKIERKIRDLKEDVRLGDIQAQAKLFEQEELWVKVAEHIDWLEN